MEMHIDSYLESKLLAWSQSTQRSESHRLRKHVPEMLGGPDAHYKKYKNTLGAYTLKTIFVRLSHFNQWLIDSGKVSTKTNVYREFMKTNARLFKHAYVKEKVEFNYEEAKSRIENIKDERIKAKAMQLLASGARWTESTSVDKSGYVIGKGGKRRKLFNTKHIDFKFSYSFFIKKLKEETGLKPHSIRKLFATELAERGFSGADLMQVFGWSSIQTASSYFQSKRDDELSDKLAQVTK